MAKNLVSVIVPVYNCERYLSQCIDSILLQTYQNFELILVNDGSTDGSPRLCDEYSLRDSRIRVIHKKNGGVSSARNMGIEVSRGQHITFVDADDFIAPNYLEAMCEAMLADVDVVMCKFAYCTSNGICNSPEKIPDKVCLGKKNIAYIQFVSRFLTLKDNIFGSACRVLWKRDVIEDLRFNPTICISEDLLFLLQSFSNASALKTTECVGYFYRINDSSATKSHKKNYLRSQLNLYRELSLLLGSYDGMKFTLQAYDALLCYYVFSNEIKFHPKGWHQNIREARKSELYPYFKLKNGLKNCGIKQKIKFFLVWFLVKIRVV